MGRGHPQQRTRLGAFALDRRRVSSDLARLRSHDQAAGALTGTLLPGITRDSLLKLAPQLGIKAVEEPITIDQWQAESAAGELTEVFACGTAAVITPVGQVKSDSVNWAVADGEPGPVTMRLREELIAIQYGHRPDPFNWNHKIC